MSRWFRHYAGMMRDDKLVRVAIRTKQTIERVVWVWGAILESAAEIDDNGRYDFDAAEAAYFLRADEDELHAIEAGLADAGRIAAGAVVKWGERQFKSDRSAARQADYRERKRQEKGGDHRVEASPNGGVTSLSRHGDAPETETELDPTPAKAVVGARKRASSAQGERLAGDFVVPDDWIEWAMAEKRWSRADAEAEAACFVDYWHAKPGKEGRKSDWPATWRNWIRRSHRPEGSGGRAATAKPMTDADRAAYLAKLESAPWASSDPPARPEQSRDRGGPARPIAQLVRHLPRSEAA